MDIKNVVAVFIIGLIVGFIGGGKFMQDKNSFKLHKTRSGTFIIDDNASGGAIPAKIFEVLELPTNKTSFQNHDLGDDLK